MNKLPTVEETFNNYAKDMGYGTWADLKNAFSMSPFELNDRIFSAANEHTRVHTEALREENERLKEALKDIGSYKDEAFIHPHPQVLAKSMSLLALETLKGEKS